MIDHVGFPVSDFERAKTFYRAALAPLGYDLLMEFAAEETGDAPAAGFGRDGMPDFWIGGAATVHGHVHVALSSADRASVDAFHQAAMAAGATDNGGPGLRPHYHPNYYAAFVLDPDGHNIEVVCHTPA